MRLARTGIVAVVVACCLPAPAGAHHRALYAAGDIACAPGERVTATTCRQAATARLLPRGASVAVLGDAQYERGALAAFRRAYDRSWGAVRHWTRPVPGNHEYETRGAAGYFAYFGRRAGSPARGYYAWHKPGWLLLALNSNCHAAGGCGRRSAQWHWLDRVLRADRRRCILAYWHHPRFSSAGRAARAMRPIWARLYRARADVVLNGHEHVYERFRRQRASGRRTRAGIRQFVVGTGGRSHGGWGDRIHHNSVRRNAHTFGVLRMRLRTRSYEWRFLPIAGRSFTDSGRTRCH